MAYYMAISFVSWFSSLLPLAGYLRSKQPSRQIKMIAILAIASFMADLASYYFGSQRINTYPIANSFLLFQSIVLLLLYRDALKLPQSPWMVGTFIYVLFFIWNTFWIQGPFVINSNSAGFGSLIFIILSLLYFRMLLKQLPETYIHRIPMVWINIAVLIYCGGNLFLFLLYNYFISGVWILHNILNITKNVLFFVAIWQSQRKINSISS